MKGKFIVFEGIDGSGTSTQSQLLAEFFQQKQNSCFLTSEPSSGPIGNLIRQGLMSRWLTYLQLIDMITYTMK